MSAITWHAAIADSPLSYAGATSQTSIATMSARPMTETIVSASRAVSPPIVGTHVPAQTELSRLSTSKLK